MHFKAAESVYLQHPGSLYTKNLEKSYNGSQISPDNSLPVESQHTTLREPTYSIMASSKGLDFDQGNYSKLKASKSSFFLPLKIQGKQLDKSAEVF